MFHLDIKGTTKSYTYNPKTNELFYNVQKSQQNTLTLTPTQRSRRLLDLHHHRSHVRGLERRIYTAFMMKLAKGFTSCKQAREALVECRVSQSDKLSLESILQDVFVHRVEVFSFPKKLISLFFRLIMRDGDGVGMMNGLPRRVF
jgi:hypothetical protein